MEKRLLKADELPWFRGNEKLKDLYLPIPSDISINECIKDVDNMIAKYILGNGCKLFGLFTCPTCKQCLAKRLSPHFLYVVYKYVGKREDKFEFTSYSDYRLINDN